MKIVTNTSRNGEVCYIQVKDFLYIGRVLGDKTFINEYTDLLNLQKSDYDFIKISSEDKRKIIKNVDLIDFKETYRDSEILLTRSLINLAVFSSMNEAEKQRSEDIRDVLAFKRGELHYNIPLLSDGETELISNDGNLIFSSTIIPNSYSLKTLDGSDIKSYDYQEFLSYCMNKLKDLYGDNEGKIYNINNMVVVKFNSLNKTKENRGIKFLKKKIFGQRKNED